MEMLHPEAQKAMRIICSILQQSGGRFDGKVRLNKTFYFAHLMYWESESRVLSDYPIVRLPHGPAIDDLDLLLTRLVQDGHIRIEHHRVGPYVESSYVLVSQNFPSLDQTENESIGRAVAWVNDKSGTELSNLTHEHSRSWQTTPNGQEMRIYLDTLNDEEFEEMAVRQQEIRGELGDIFSA